MSESARLLEVSELKEMPVRILRSTGNSCQLIQLSHQVFSSSLIVGIIFLVKVKVAQSFILQNSSHERDNSLYVT